MKEPKISVVMSAYNSDIHIDKAIESILAQDFSDFEFIIIDDNSSDATFRILSDYKKKDDRIHIIKNESNMGLAASLNKGIKIAKGQYIARQDADDISMRNRISRQLEFLEQNKDISMTGTFYEILGENGKLLYKIRLPCLDAEIKEYLKSVNCFCHGSVMFRRSALEKIGFYPEQYRCSQDYALWLKMSKDYKLANMPEFLYKLNLHEKATSVKNKNEQWKCIFRIKNDFGILKNSDIFSDKFIINEFLYYGRFFYKMRVKKLGINYFIKGWFYKIFGVRIWLNEKKSLGICMVTGVFYPEISGGSLQCRTLIDSLKHDSRYSFFILTTTRGTALSNDYKGIPVIRIYVGNMGFLAQFYATIRLIDAFLKLQSKVDIIHLHGFSNKTMLIILMAKIFKKKIIQKMTSLGDDDPVSIYKKKLGLLKKCFFSRADMYISVNPVMFDEAIKSGISSNKLAMIPNGVDIDRFSPSKSLEEKTNLRKELNLPKDAVLILFVGFFSKDKGPDILFDAYKDIVSKFKGRDIRLLFIGPQDINYYEIKKDLMEKIKREIKICNMETKVIFIEKTLEIEKYYRASDVFVLPSLREGLPNALLEAMSTGLGCIASNLEGVADYLISNEEGLVFKKGDTNELSQALVKLINDRRLIVDFGKNARLKIIRDFSINQIAEQYYKIYNLIDK